MGESRAGLYISGAVLFFFGDFAPVCRPRCLFALHCGERPAFFPRAPPVHPMPAVEKEPFSRRVLAAGDRGGKVSTLSPHRLPGGGMAPG